MPSCIINGCSNTAFKNHVKFYCIPSHTKFPELAEKWINMAKAEIKKKYDEALARQEKINNRLFRVCEIHFDRNCFITISNNRKLQDDVIPTLFLGAHADSESAEISHPSVLPSISRDVANQLPASKFKNQSPVSTKSISTQTENSFYSRMSVGTQVDECQITTEIADINLLMLDNISRDHTYAFRVSTPEDECCLGVPINNSNFDQSVKTPKGNTLFHSTPSKIIQSNCKNFSPLSSNTDKTLNPEIGSVYEPSTIEDIGSLYEPSTIEDTRSSTIDSNFSNISEGENIVKERKFIIFESELNKLLCRTVCQNLECTSVVDKSTISKSETEGSMLTVKYTCINGHENIWKSQPLLGKMPAGNLLIASAVLLTGNTFHPIESFFEYFGIKGISSTTYYKIQRHILVPELKSIWENEQDDLFSEARSRDGLKLSADGRCDSRGHSARYCIETLMEQGSNKCIHFEIVQKTEVDHKSTNMELEALKRCMDKMKRENLKISQLTTDRHTQVRAYMKKSHPGVDHQFDVWHLAKSIRKKITAASKKKKTGELEEWVKSISRHLWFCSENCEGDPDILVEGWRSIVYHTINVHSFPELSNFTQCAHEPIREEVALRKKWLKPTSEAHKALKDIVNNKSILKDLRQINQFSHTSALENYHSLMNKYCSKDRF